MAFPANAANGNFIVTNPQMNVLAAHGEPAYHQIFLKGQPKAQGAIQISLAFAQFAVGTVLLFTLNAFTSITVYSWIAYWGGVFYIISGSISVSAVNKQSRGLVKGSLSTNIISALVSLGEVSLIIIDLARAYYYNFGPCYSTPCSLFQDTILVIRLIALIFLVLISFLQFCMSISIFAFSIRALKAKTPDVPQELVIQNDYQKPADIPSVNVMPEKTDLTEMNANPAYPPQYNTQQQY